MGNFFCVAGIPWGQRGSKEEEKRGVATAQGRKQREKWVLRPMKANEENTGKKRFILLPHPALGQGFNESKTQNLDSCIQQPSPDETSC